MRRVSGVAALLVAGAVLAPADAASPSVLRLTGHTTGYVDLTLAKPTTFDEMKARLTTRGTYVAWWLIKIGEAATSNGNQAGGVRFVQQSPPGSVSPDYDFGFRTTALDPGRYRLYLATDGDSTVEVPATGLVRSLNLAPVRRTTSVGAVRTLAVLPGGVVRGSMREPATLSRNSLAASSLVAYSAPGVTVESLAACVVRPQGSCDEPGQPGAYSGYAMSLFTDFGVQVTAHYPPGTLPAGPHEGVQGLIAGPGVTKVVGSLFQLTTVP